MCGLMLIGKFVDSVKKKSHTLKPLLMYLHWLQSSENKKKTHQAVAASLELICII